jgi:predicted flap endonuclease-1-like 5' DNA nuclease
MMRIFKGVGLFISGLGISLVVGWWLAERERAKGQTGQASQAGQGPISVAPMMPPPTPSMSEPAIVLPPEAFDAIEDITELTAEKTAKAEKVEKPAMEATVGKPVAEIPAKSAKNEKAAKTKRNDLTIIKGIGPKKAEALASIGITTFAQLAAANAEELREQAAGVGSVEQLEEWIAAAKEFKT